MSQRRGGGGAGKKEKEHRGGKERIQIIEERRARERGDLLSEIQQTLYVGRMPTHPMKIGSDIHVLLPKQCII